MTFAKSKIQNRQSKNSYDHLICCLHELGGLRYSGQKIIVDQCGVVARVLN